MKDKEIMKNGRYNILELIQNIWDKISLTFMRCPSIAPK